MRFADLGVLQGWAETPSGVGDSNVAAVAKNIYACVQSLRERLRLFVEVVCVAGVLLQPKRGHGADGLPDKRPSLGPLLMERDMVVV